MAGSIGKLAAFLTLDISGFRSGARQVEIHMQKLKGSFGRGSLFGQAGSILAGGGMIAGVTLLTHQLKQAADRALDLTKQFRDGKIGAAELGAEVAKSLPIMGEFVGMWDSSIRLAMELGKGTWAEGFTNAMLDPFGGRRENAALAEQSAAAQAQIDKQKQFLAEAQKLQSQMRMATAWGDEAKKRAQAVNERNAYRAGLIGKGMDSEEIDKLIRKYDELAAAQGLQRFIESFQRANKPIIEMAQNIDRVMGAMFKFNSIKVKAPSFTEADVNEITSQAMKMQYVPPAPRTVGAMEFGSAEAKHAMFGTDSTERRQMEISDAQLKQLIEIAREQRRTREEMTKRVERIYRLPE